MAMALVRFTVWSDRLPVAAAASSTRAAFCWVTVSRWPTAWFTWAMPRLCSRVAAVISTITLATCPMEPITSSIDWPAWAVRAMPAFTLVSDTSIRPLISLAAAALRWARARTSLATTANPRPDSPARAASTAAFNAKMLVWNAMLSITPMMSPILRDDWLMSSMVCTTRATTPPLSLATCDAWLARVLACSALPALCDTVAVSCSMLAAVCSRLEACASVRLDRSMLPVAISCVARLMASKLCRTSPMMLRRLMLVCRTAFCSWPMGSSPAGSMFWDKSPPARMRAPPVT